MFPTTNAATIVQRFRQQRILVVGEAMLDCYYHGRAERISPEGPVPVVQAGSKMYYPGGACNAAANVAALGGTAHCLSVVGQDEAAAQLRAAVTQHGVMADFVEDAGRATLTKLRILADDQYVVRWDEGERTPLSAEVEQELIGRLQVGFAAADAVIVADYCYGVLSPRIIAEIGRLKAQHGRLVLVDSKSLPAYRGMTASVITPNHLEAQKALGWNVRDVDRLTATELEALGRAVLDSIQAEWALVTLGAKGSLLFQADAPTQRIAPRPVARAHVSGAGDTFTATLALALAAGAPPRLAAEIAADAAAIAVAKPGTATVTAQELLQRLAQHSSVGTAGLALSSVVARHRQAGRRIVFTNGVFDGLNAGHVAFLHAARQLGDVLIVGVNSDQGAAVRRGTLPQHSQAERVALVAALGSVDHVVVFDEPTPQAVIALIAPDIHAKGGDHSGAELPEAATVQAHGGEVVILPLFPGDGGPGGEKVVRV